MVEKRTDWSDCLSLRLERVERTIENLPSGIQMSFEAASDGVLLETCGSRTLPWRIFLGLLSEDPCCWPEELQKTRQEYA